MGNENRNGENQKMTVYIQGSEELLFVGIQDR